jgi:tRNA threonylcarbamoyladenosine biosynthesis protein TsaE
MQINRVFDVENEAAMADVARVLVPWVENGAILALEGNLGAGKTALARALIRELCNDPALDVPSPTFTLVQTYDNDRIWHFDFYRLKHPDEAFELGWEEAMASGGIIILEWGERIGPYLPTTRIQVAITPQENGSRKVEVRA